jgi:3-oxoadipate enol-lactonase
MPFAPVPGTRLHFRMSGTRGRPALVFSNSLGADLTMWDPQVAALAATHCVIRYDTRGHGESGATAGPYSVELLARDLLALLDHLDITRASFCGLSLGGMIGMRLAIHAPHRIDRLVLANTAARIAPPDLWNARIEKVNAGGMAAISDAVIARWFTPEFIAADPGTFARTKAMMERVSPEGYVACCAAVRDMDQRDEIARITAPTLVITGARDVATPPADGQYLASQIRGARLVELPAAHVSNIEQAAAFTAALTQFLGE